MSTSILVVSGEHSGDILGANLISKFPKQTDFFGVVGEHLKNEGVREIKNIDELGDFGFSKVILKLPKLLKLKKRLLQEAKYKNAEAAILIDYPGFNLRLAKDLKREGIKVIYYVSPQIWAWYFRRIKKIKKYVDLMIPLLPFEQNMYTQYGINALFFGHPFMEIVQPELTEKQFFDKYSLQKPFLTVMPGSRKGEIKKIFPDIVKAKEILEGKLEEALQVVIPIAPSIPRNYITDLIPHFMEEKFLLIDEDRFSAIKYSKLVVTTSGSATLETGIIGTPMIVVYKTDFFSWLLIKLVSKVDYASLVNILLQEEAVPELLQYECNPPAIANEIERLWDSSQSRNVQVNKFKLLENKLGDENASQKAADKIMDFVEN